MKKKIVVILLVLVLALSCAVGISACNKKEKGINELTVWASGQWTGTDLQNLKSFIAQYNDSNTLGITVEVVAKTDIETALSTAVRNNKIPDVLIWDRFNTPTYAEVDSLLDITEYINRDGVDVSLFNDEAMTEMYYGGKYYGLPLDLDVWGTYVNMDKVNNYNAAHPSDQIVLNDNWTWDDLYSIATKLTEFSGGDMVTAGYTGHVMHQHYFKYLTSASQEFLNADGDPNFDTKQSRDVLNFFYKIGHDGEGRIWQNGKCEKSNFTAGDVAMIDQSLYFTDYIDIYGKNMNYKFMPQPRYSVNGIVQEGAVNGGMLGGFGLAFPKPDARFLNDEFYEKFEIAWKFAKDWLLNEDMQSKWSQETGTLPALKSLYDSEVVLSNTTLNRAASFVDNYRIRPQIPSYLVMQTSVIDTSIKAYTEGQITIDQVIDSMIEGCKDNM